MPPPRCSSSSTTDDDDDDDEEEEEELVRRRRLHQQQQLDYARTGRFSPLGYFLRKLDAWLMHLFFGDVDIVGLENIPTTGPCLLVGNHKNQFVDALMIVYVANRPVSFLVAEKSMHLGLVGLGARLTGAIPVVRPQDLARAPPAGAVLVDYQASTRVLTGSNECQFDQECELGEQVSIRGYQPVAIVEILDATRIRVKSTLVPEGGATTPIAPSGTKYKLVPKVEQKEMYDRVFAALEQGKCIGIFPEGGSSDRTDLLPLKQGVSVMALGARSKRIPVQVVPFGINYQRGDVWRSKVMVHVGKPVPLPQELVERYESAEDGRKQATADFLLQVERRLRGVTFNAPDQRTLLIMRVMRKLFQGPSPLQLAEFMELNRRFALAFSKFSANKRFLDLVGRVHAYINLLESMRVSDREIAALPRLGGVRERIKSLAGLLACVLAVVSSFLLFLPVWLVFLPSLLRINCVVRHEVRRALAGSTVKVFGKDVAASQKIFTAMVWMPFTVLVCFLVALAACWRWWDERVGNPFRADEEPVWFWLHQQGAWLVPVLVLVLLPVLGVVHIRVFDFQLNRLQWSGYYRLTLLYPHEANKLRELRKELAFRVQEFYHDSIRPQFPEWEREEILPRSQVVKLRAQSDYEASERVLAELEREEAAGEDEEDVEAQRGAKVEEEEEEDALTEEEQQAIRLLQPNMISVGGRISSNNRLAEQQLELFRGRGG